MVKSITFFYLVLITSVAAQSPCPGNSAISGYSSIADLNSAMTTDLNAIRGGAAPKPPYIFTICPNAVLNAKEPLTPMLSGAEFVCGSDGALSNSCTILGGTNQVSIQDSTVPGYTLQNITFKGITFNVASNSSIVGSASSATTANFIDCSWTGFSGNNAVQISSTSPKAMTVAITGGIVQNGNANDIFSNDKGSLQINGLTVTGSKGVSGIVTSDGGTTTLNNATFATNDLQTVTSTTSGGSLNVDNTDVSGSGSTLQKVFDATGTGTTMNINGTTIHDISIPGSLWDAFTYASGASGEVQGSQVLRSSGLQFGIDAEDGGTATVVNSTFGSNTAATNTVSSLLNALNNSKLTVQDTTVIDNTGFTTLGFTGFQSFTQYDNATFQGGGTVLIAIFVDQNSKFGFNNLVFTNVNSDACPPPNQREFLEDIGSHCFYRGPGACTGICGVLQNHTLAPTPITTHAPSVSTTLVPSSAPVATTTTPSSQATTSQPTFTGTATPTSSTSSPTTTSPQTSTTTAPTSSATIVPGLPTARPLVPTVAPVAPTAAPVSAATPTPSVTPPATTAPSITPVAPSKVPTAADKGSKKPYTAPKKTRSPVRRTKPPRARKTRPPVRRTRAPTTKSPVSAPKTAAPTISAYPTYIYLASTKPTPAPSQQGGGKKGKKGKKGKQASLAPIVYATAAPSISGTYSSSASAAPAAPSGKGGKGGQKGGTTSAPFAAAGTPAPTITAYPTGSGKSSPPQSSPSVSTPTPTISFAPFLSGVIGSGKSAKKGGSTKGSAKGFPITSKKVRPQYASKQKKGQITPSGDDTIGGAVAGTDDGGTNPGGSKMGKR